MYLLVYKFGGSSVADAAGLRCAAGQLAAAAAAGFHIIAVVSAQGKTTDRLLQSTAELTAHPACREADQLLATGEQASAALMAMTLQERGLPAVSLTGWQAGIHTDGNHAAAEITALHRRRILRELEAGKIVIVAGFQGVDREGDITTLGRGGSDTTAVALAAAFDACGCRICTDVDGVYDRDPREFPQSRRYERIPYDEMLEMAEGGAKVLHPRSVFLAWKYRVPLKVLRTGAETPCTVVGLEERQHHSLAADTTFLYRSLGEGGPAGVVGIGKVGAGGGAAGQTARRAVSAGGARWPRRSRGGLRSQPGPAPSPPLTNPLPLPYNGSRNCCPVRGGGGHWMRFWDYLRYRRRMLLAAAVCCVIFAASFALYRLPLRAVLYPVGLCLLVGLGFAVWDYRRTLKRHRALTGCGDLTAELLRELPPPESLAEEDYRAQLLHLRQLCIELQSAADNRYRDAIEYYTTWAHQIKTPIASMRLALQGEDTALFRRLLSDLSRTEQYVEMVMAFLRLEDAPGDYVFREVALDEVLRQALRRFSAEFIDRRLRLDYTPTGLTVLTDEKWLCFVLEQLLSNALKYTREGSITVELAGERVLAIRDTGIGIAPEDLPRIFEKGYTGQNGRADKRASGLGLYLCSRICRNLGVGLTVKSTSGVGTTLLLDFTQYPLRVE